MIEQNYCILCGRKLTGEEQLCSDCRNLEEILISIYEDAKKELSTNPSVEREPIFKILREFAFVVQEDALLGTYKQTIKFFMNQFIDENKTEVTLELFAKKVPTRLNHLKILRELSSAGIISWDPSSLGVDPSPKIFPGPVINNLKIIYNRSSVGDRTEQRFGHVLGFYSIFPLLINYGASKSKEEMRNLNIIPKKPWLTLLAIIIGNPDNKISLERTNKFLKKRRSTGNVYATIITNLSSLSPEYIQKATVSIQESDDNDRTYILSDDIVKYLERLRERSRSR